MRQRAQARCEYCRLPQAAQPFVSFHIEHIVAKQHGGNDEPGNLCLSCQRCNSFKGPNLTGIDPESRQVTELFHPRRHRWEDHFEWRGIYLTGKTAIGRATVRVLKMNSEDQLALRSS